MKNKPFTASLQRPSGTAGNALLIVLIGIALFTALIFTISRGNRSSVNTTENAAIYANEIISYANKIDNAVQTVMIQNGCLASQISFENSEVAGYTNGAVTKCQVFSADGGGATFTAPPEQAIDNAAADAAASTLAGNYFFSGNICFADTGTGPPLSACAATNAELVIVLPWVKEEVCRAINIALRKSSDIPADANSSFNGTKFTGTYAATYAISTGDTTYASGCYESSSTSPPGTGYHFYQVLLAR